MTNETYIFAGASSKMAIETANNLQKNGAKVIGISTKNDKLNCDDFYQIEKYDFGLFPAIEEPISGLVYFPGTINLKPFNRLNSNDFITDFQINALGAVAFVQAYLNNLKKLDSASIVFMSTVAVSIGMPYHSSIAMAKGAIEGLTKSLAAELAPRIRVNCIAPSLVATSLSEKFINSPEKLEASSKRNPMQKVGTPNELANAIEFLLTQKSSWITGQILAVDGGMNNLKI